MKVKMKTRECGPNGNFAPGDEREVTEEIARLREFVELVVDSIWLEDAPLALDGDEPLREAWRLGLVVPMPHAQPCTLTGCECDGATMLDDYAWRDADISSKSPPPPSPRAVAAIRLAEAVVGYIDAHDPGPAVVRSVGLDLARRVYDESLAAYRQARALPGAPTKTEGAEG